MKTTINNTILLTLSILALSALSSCSEKEIEPDPTAGLIQIASGYAIGAGVKTEIYAVQEFFAGYNTVYLALFDSVSGNRITQADIVLTPLMDMPSTIHSCPVENPSAAADGGLFPSSIMFTMPSGEMGSWTLRVDVNTQGKAGKSLFDIDVQATSPSKVLSFVSPEGERFYLSYSFPDKLRTGVNNFEIIAFKSHGDEFIPVENLIIQMTPEMPSMNHGSPNNSDPTHAENGHYKGKVNFTMTGEWRINLIIRTPSSSIGTKYFDVNVE
jgi:hypothetical protein